MYRKNLPVFGLEGKIPEEKEILNISDSWLEMLFLSISVS